VILCAVICHILSMECDKLCLMERAGLASATRMGAWAGSMPAVGRLGVGARLLPR
jgi:hypothetical protein